eukprot:3039616-Prymnesium_polylepis.1
MWRWRAHRSRGPSTHTRGAARCGVAAGGARQGGALSRACLAGQEGRRPARGRLHAALDR